MPSVPYWAGRDDTAAGDDVYASGAVVGVDLNDGHLALRRLDAHGNRSRPAQRIDIDLTGSASRRDAQVRHAITTLIHYTRRHHIAAIAVADLDFADARMLGRETMGRGARGKRFRRTVSGSLPQCSATGCPVCATEPVSSCWRSIPPTSVSGVPSIGSVPTPTSPDTRQPPR